MWGAHIVQRRTSLEGSSDAGSGMTRRSGLSGVGPERMTVFIVRASACKR